ncbi:hypothetical protein [Aeromicrobium sp. 179-A 4D2 NHS]|uniref:hypothetical protein n=1 Tax=Aeromicrobium sp. 179-A 4D2 NHS TaxID=3142375 RepID=UPI0039A24FF8
MGLHDRWIHRLNSPHINTRQRQQGKEHMNEQQNATRPARSRFAFLRSDDGDMLMEALATMLIVALTIAAFSVAFVSVNQTQNRMQKNDIATQAARGVVEHAKSVDWDMLGYLPTDAGYAATFTDKGNTYETVTLNPAEVDPEVDRVKPTEEVTIRGTKVNIRTHVRRDGNGKSLLIFAQYRASGSTKTKTMRAHIAPDARSLSGAKTTGAAEQPADNHKWWGD